jgi:hypothetical protein
MAESYVPRTNSSTVVVFRAFGAGQVALGPNAANTNMYTITVV